MLAALLVQVGLRDKAAAGRDRVYKNFDPRAKIIREVAEEVFEIQGRDPLINVAVELERIARSDNYFVSRKLYPNVDFYSGAHARCSVSVYIMLLRRRCSAVAVPPWL